MTATIPAAISQFVQTTNDADPDSFVTLFTPDAVLDDWGRTFIGRDQIAAWNRTDNMGVQSHLEITALHPGSTPDSHAATVTVSGKGYNGSGTMTFTLHDGLISALTIS